MLVQYMQIDVYVCYVLIALFIVVHAFAQFESLRGFRFMYTLTLLAW